MPKPLEQKGVNKSWMGLM